MNRGGGKINIKIRIKNIEDKPKSEGNIQKNTQK